MIHRLNLRWLKATAIAALLLGLTGAARAATHYPAGSLCYDCHAVSKAKMVVGTHLIKKSDKTVALGITGSSSPIRCLFCHEKNAVSAQARTEMRGVWDHYDSTSASKHPVKDAQGLPAQYSTFTADGAAFDCLDCHPGLSAGVVSDGLGNATVHGVDAATANVNLYSTMLGAPTGAAQVSANTCQNANCHDADGATIGGYTAPRRHAMAASTINGVAPTSCTQCHGDHNSYQNTSLVVLRDDGTVSNSPTDPVGTAVTPDQCGTCHNQDDGGTHNYGGAGHGKAGIALACTNCHSAVVPHDFPKSGANPLRFSVAENKALQSTIRQQPPYNQVYSICLTCHAQFESMVHGGTTGYRAGCNDCHEPHGDGIGANIRMIREQIPKVNAAGAPVYGDVSATGTWDTNVYTGPATGTGASLCDNAECHQGRLANGVAGYTLYPLTTFLTGGRHSGGDMATSAECESCHKHSDPGGGFGAVASCDGCHGNPPPTNAHLAHNGAGIGCASCHPGPGVTNHNGANITDAATFANTMLASPATIRNQVDVAFTGAVYTAGAYTPAKGSRVGTTYAADGCTTNCHGGGLPVASRGTDIAPGWNLPASGACGTCHKATAASMAATGSGSHVLHAGTAPNRAFGCQQCHANTTTDGTTIKAGGSHLDGNSSNDILGGGTFAVGGSVSMSYTDGTADGVPNGTCSTITCHGSYANTVWGAAVDTCSNCHGTFGTTANGVAMPATVVAKHSGALADPDANASTTLYNSHQGTAALGASGEGRCDFCHANTQAAYTAAMHLDGQVQLNTSMNYQTASGGCTGVCHAATAPYVMSDSGLTVATIAGQSASDCSACHGSPTTDRNNFSGNDSVPSLIHTGAEWTTYGHGAKGVACTGCHDTGTSHDATATLSGTNPFRLIDQDGGTAGVQFSCTWNNAACHDGNPTASVATVRSHTPNDMIAGGYPNPRYDGAAGGWGFLPACVNCHDPHGDGANVKMVQKQLYDKAAFGLPAGPPPAAPTEQTNLTLTDLTTGLSATGTSYVDTAAKSNICQECHEGTPGTNTTKGFVDGHATLYGNYSGHPGYVSSANDNPTDCGTCHKHSEGFRPGGCNGCHGGSLAGEGNNNWWPDGAAYPDRAGAHQAHIDAIYTANSGTLAGATATDKKNSTCNWCHPNPGAVRGGTTGDVAHNDNVTPADIHGDGRTGAPVTNFKTITAAANSVQGTYANGTAVGQKSCASVDCHYKVTTPSTGTAPNVGWFNAADVATCSNCHGSGIAGAALPNAHPQHVGNAAGQKAYGCWYCHPSGVNNASYTMSHQTGQLNWSFANTLDPGATRTETYNALATGSKAVSYGAGTYSTCANVYCHIQTPSPAWNATISATQCTLCHQTGQTAAPNPSSGLHYGAAAVTVSQTKHDDTLDATNKCAVCHTQVLTQATHSDGLFQGGLGQKTQMGLGAFTAYTQTADGVGTCSGAGAPPTGVNTGCHDGAGDAGTWARKWDSSIHYATTGAECAGCHGGMNETDWTFGSVANTTDGSVEHNRDWNGNAATGEVIGNHQNTATNATKCNICHVYADAPYNTAPIGWQPKGTSTNHGDGQIAMNSTMGYSRTAGAGPAYGCSSNCHAFTNSGLEASGWTLQSVAGPALTCTSCHSGSGSGALAVGNTSTHTKVGKAAGYNTFVGCTECHPGGTKGKTHTAYINTTTRDANVVGVPNSSYAAITTSVGIDYGHNQWIPAMNTFRNGLVLGGDKTTGTTEAEICWNCHANTTYQGAGGQISEWGVNQKTDTGNFGYNYGNLTTFNWVVATWSSAVPSFSYKGQKIQSVHTANPSTLGGPTSNTGDTVGQIRCSYCHDVHGVKGAMTASPYLRGSYRGNPYIEDGAPRAGMTFPSNTSTFRFGRVPRGSNAKPGTGGLPTYGGYNIDQNNANPTSAMTAAEFGGLCELCHGNGDGTFSSAEIGALNVFGGMGDWVSSYNGHANAVKGGAGPGSGAEATARNIFRNADRNPNGWGTGNSDASRPLMGYINIGTGTSIRRYGFRSVDGDGYSIPPLIAACYANSTGVRWNVSISTGTTESGYHQFSCSKCHNPHASRLPRLMITNCLDTKQNTWDDAYRVATGTSGNAEAILSTDDSYARKMADWTSAQNCHRKGNATSTPVGRGAGWNKVTPW